MFQGQVKSGEGVFRRILPCAAMSQQEDRMGWQRLVA
jgi:hypothetical protein